MPKILVDGISYEVAASSNLLEALLTLKRDLPYFCWHPSMGSIGACRQCAVIQYRNADDQTGRIVMACMTQVTEGAMFSTDLERAQEFRRDVIENMMTNHPHDCPVCEEGGECHLQDMTVMTGHHNRKYKGTKATFRNQRLGPFINHEMNRCITCYRCVRFYKDYAGGHDLAAFASRNNTYFGRQQDGPLESEFSGNLVEVCPTGVFTDRTLSQHYTRKWDLQSAPSICTGCALGCNTLASERYGKFRRIHNRFSSDVNGYFLCDRGRFGGGFVNSNDRIPQAGLRNAEGKYEPIAADKALDLITDYMSDRSEQVVGIGSPRASLESNYLLQQIVGNDNFYSGMSGTDQLLTSTIIDILSNGNVRTPSMAQVEEADAVLVLGEDVTNTSPRLALALRQSLRNRAKELATAAQIPLWQDAAVRNLAQNDLSPLVLLTPYNDRLDDVAELSHRAAPDAIARLGYAIANRLDNQFAAIANPSDTEQQLAETIAGILRSAKRPLIVSGSGARSSAVIEAAANIASALARSNHATGILFCLPECNSLGVGLLHGASGNTLDRLLSSTGRIGTAIVMENDLYRRAPASRIDAFLARVDHLVVLDTLDNPTASASQLVLPAASFAETDATLVNSEGRAQRSFSVFSPAGTIQGSWQWLLKLGKCLDEESFSALEQFDDVTTQCAASVKILAGIINEAPAAGTRVSGMKAARMTHRSSGRTAMWANIRLHEAQQPIDQNSALAYTMEGISGPQAGALAAYYWAPGWNSNQSLHKFQTETGGPLTNGLTGVRLIEPASDGSMLHNRFTSPPAAASSAAGTGFTLLPRYHIFGSDELSAATAAIAERAPASYIAINPAAAESLSVTSKEGVEFTLDGKTYRIEVVVDASVPAGYALFPAGLAGVRELMHQAAVSLKKAADWSPRTSTPDRLIAKQ